MISVIIPVHEFDDKVSKMLEKAVTSVKDQIDFEVSELIIVYPIKISKQIETTFVGFQSNFKLTLVENQGNFKFQDQINLAVEHVLTPYFSILEFDDVYSKVYFRNVKKYVEAYEEVDLFLPIVIETTTDENGKAKLLNDHIWSKSHMQENGEMGFVSIKSLQEYTVMNVTGGVFKTGSYKMSGGLKKNIELTFWYEMLLRMCNSGMKIFVIPKVGYQHVANRDNSLFMYYKNTLNQKQKSFWFETANKEYYFPTDRVIVQEETV